MNTLLSLHWTVYLPFEEFYRTREMTHWRHQFGFIIHFFETHHLVYAKMFETSCYTSLWSFGMEMQLKFETFEFNLYPHNVFHAPRLKLWHEKRTFIDGFAGV